MVDGLPGTTGRDRKQSQFITGVGCKGERYAMRCGLSLEEEKGWTPAPRLSTVTLFSVALLQRHRHGFPLLGLELHHQPAALPSPLRGRRAAEAWGGGGGVAKSQRSSERAQRRARAFMTIAAIGAALG